MCLITNTQPKTATEDITVYKLLKEGIDNKAISAYFPSFYYILEQLTQTSIEESDEFCCTDAIDSRQLDDRFGRNGWQNPHNTNDVKCYGEGFHSFKTEDRAGHHSLGGARMYKCSIPAGSIYYEDRELFVSNQIIIHKPE